ncbi:ParA family protein, partial [Xanthomonas citri pv. citri]|nr:ParA family protein [Xanthomonas citri pv. citri]
PTLVIDMDPQGNITSSLAGESVTEDQAGVADALSTRAPETLQDVLVPTIWSNVTLAPTVGDVLAVVRDEMVIAGAGRESRLKEAL